MAIFTSTEVQQAAASATGTMYVEGVLGERVITARADGFFEAQASEARRLAPTRFDIFLSHAYEDKATVTGVYSLLKVSGFSVYVDWIHDRHRFDRTKVTAANAAILRERMHQCSALFYVTTKNHGESRWMPWECGYFDGYDSKKLSETIQAGHVAILPVLESATTGFQGVEYLGLYPIAQKGSLPMRNVNIHNQQSPARYLHFDQWVSNGHP
jgi:hypothetical protein